MFIDKDTLKRVNIYAAYKGRSRLDTPEIREAVGVIEIPDPVRESDETHYNQEIDDAPYLICTPKSPEQLAALRWSKLKQHRDELTDNGGCLVAGKWFHTDPKSKQQQMALAMVGTALPPGIMWKTMDGSFVLMTSTLAAELFQAQMQRDQQIFAIAEAKRNDDTPITEGWPARYEAAQ